MIPQQTEEHKFELRTKWLEIIGAVLGIGYKLAIAIGALVTFAYLFIIHFFPSSLTPGEVIFFVFIALAFGFTYFVFLLYGAFSMLWFAHIFSYLLKTFQFRYRKKHLLNGAQFAAKLKSARDARVSRTHNFWSRGRRSIRAFRRFATRSAIQRKTLVPAAAQGWFFALLSFAIALFLVVEACVIDSTRLWEILLAASEAGFIVNALLAVKIKPERKLQHQLIKWTGITVFPLVIVCFNVGPLLLLELAFQGMGIRIPNVSIEIPASEAGGIERLSGHIQRPLIDCKRPQPDRVLVHGGDVLWTGVGDQTVVRFSAQTNEKRSLFAPETELAASGIVRFDSKSIRIVKISPRLDPCFDIPSDLLFETGSHTLTPEAREHIKKLVETFKKMGEPSHILVRGHSDPRPMLKPQQGVISDNQRLSEQRAAAIADVIKGIAQIPELQVRSEGAGSREPKVKCAANAGETKYELDRCNLPNRRVEIQVAYKIPSKLGAQRLKKE